MPSRNAVKIYSHNSYYHVYIRGVEKKEIFRDSQDYRVFLSYLKTYLTEKHTEELQNQLTNQSLSWTDKEKALKLLRLNNFFGEIKLCSYCLMPNHYHLLLWQRSETGMDRFMRSLNTRYVAYVNRRYGRIGPLFQGVYKAVLVETDEQLIQLSRYIHNNSFPLLQGLSLQKLDQYPYSSFAEYVGMRNTEWVDTSIILRYFSNSGTEYRMFVEDKDQDYRSILHCIIEH